ncbi:pyridoxamine 5'-phosphate oxidase family protein [Rubrolithibacter danxiaensis]|uniref:pyridoxamine 5'-phosphate oxidase family protein n=1 Tax=Rubrolithibacter danxiaensis TaxID=3390805 RepID=UPI003BF80A6E
MNTQEIQEQLNEIERIKKVRELSDRVKDVKIAMLTTNDTKGEPHSRPMYTFPIKDDGVIWFLTQKDSIKSEEITTTRTVNINYTDHPNNLYVSVTGEASLSADKEKIDELWTEMFKAWFADGKNDPNIALLKVVPHKVEYWDAPDSIMSQILLVVKAGLAGNPYQVGEHKKIDL